MVKVRIQYGSESGGSTNPFTVARQVIAEGGIRSFYRGLEPALWRECVYGTLRLGLFFNLNEFFKRRNGGNSTTPFQKVQASVTAATIAAFCGNPTDLCLIRIMTDSTLPPHERRNYTSMLNALSTIIRQEGVLSLWTGSVPTICRAICLLSSMMVSYETAKEKIMLKTQLPADNLKVQFSASMLSAVVMAGFALPADNMRTKMLK